MNKIDTITQIEAKVLDKYRNGTGHINYLRQHGIRRHRVFYPVVMM